MMTQIENNTFRRATSKSAPGAIVDGRYELRAELGRGALGVVYAALDLGLAREVAVKMIAESWLVDDLVVASLQSEARALASVRSPYVAQAHAFGSHRGGFYLVMERIRGRCLADILDDHHAQHERLPVARALRIVEQLAEGLTAVHAAGLLHRDVKPANVMIEDETGRPVLVDFGLAGPEGQNRDLEGGTPGYMPPEQAGMMDGKVTPRSDMYALACTAFVMLTGHMPFSDSTPFAILRRQLGPPARISERCPDLHALDPIFAKALAPKAADRYATCAELARALAHTLRPERTVTTARPPRSSVRPEDAGAGGPRSLSILVVDDDPAMMKLVSTAVRIAFFGMRIEVATAVTGPEALVLAAKAPPDLLIIDYQLPGLDGLETLGTLRNAAGGSGIRVLVTSTSGGLHVSQFRFSVLGVKHFLPKPATLQGLVDSVGRIADAAGWRDNVAAAEEDA